MKAFCIAFVCVLSFIMFSVGAEAYGIGYDEIFEALTPETEKMLEDFGFTRSLETDFADISLEKVFGTIKSIFTDELTSPLSVMGISLALMFASALICRFFDPSASVGGMGRRISLMCVMFGIVSMSADIFSSCSSSLLMTNDMMLVLIPVFAAVVSFGGNAALAISFNTVAFAFAEVVSWFFNGIFPSLCVVMTAISSAAAINPVVKLDGIGKTLSKSVNLIMSFVAGIFVAVLSVRGVIAGAADTVTIRGVRFIVGNSVPVVGSAVADALNSVVAGVGLLKNTVGMLGIAAVIIINLPVVIRVVIWKAAIYVICLSADILDLPEIRSFSESMNGVLSVITGAVIFVSFVFVISMAIILTVSRG